MIGMRLWNKYAAKTKNWHFYIGGDDGVGGGGSEFVSVLWVCNFFAVVINWMYTTVNSNDVTIDDRLYDQNVFASALACIHE